MWWVLRSHVGGLACRAVLPELPSNVSGHEQPFDPTREPPGVRGSAMKRWIQTQIPLSAYVDPIFPWHRVIDARSESWSYHRLLRYAGPPTIECCPYSDQRQSASRPFAGNAHNGYNINRKQFRFLKGYHLTVLLGGGVIPRGAGPPLCPAGGGVIPLLPVGGEACTHTV